jgi:methionine biosynthesis protein MetW
MNQPMMTRLRPDLALIADLIPRGSRVLDIGCGDGALIERLVQTKSCDARGIELSREGVSGAVARGLSVVQGNADTDLADYPSGTFDYAVLSQTLQATHRPADVLDQLLRIGRQAIVSVPNFAHWRARLSVMFGGRMPVTTAMPVSWYETENIHLCSLADFVDLCAAKRIGIEQVIYVHRDQKLAFNLFANARADQAIFMLKR